MSGEDKGLTFSTVQGSYLAYDQVVPDLYLRYGNEICQGCHTGQSVEVQRQPIPPEYMRPGDVVFITNDLDRMTHGGLFIEWVDDDMTEFRFVTRRRITVKLWSILGRSL